MATLFMMVLMAMMSLMVMRLMIMLMMRMMSASASTITTATAYQQALLIHTEARIVVSSMGHGELYDVYFLSAAGKDPQAVTARQAWHTLVG